MLSYAKQTRVACVYLDSIDSDDIDAWFVHRGLRWFTVYARSQWMSLSADNFKQVGWNLFYAGALTFSFASLRNISQHYLMH